MRRECVALFILWLGASPCLACSLTSPQRQAILYRAVQLLDPQASGSAEKGVFKVRAEQYFSNSRSRYIPVRKIQIHEYRSWANERTEWNMGRLELFELRWDYAEVGKTYQVRVEWEDGSTYTWEYQMKPGGTNIRIWEPR